MPCPIDQFQSSSRNGVRGYAAYLFNPKGNVTSHLSQSSSSRGKPRFSNDWLTFLVTFPMDAVSPCIMQAGLPVLGSLQHYRPVLPWISDEWLQSFLLVGYLIRYSSRRPHHKGSFYVRLLHRCDGKKWTLARSTSFALRSLRYSSYHLLLITWLKS